MRQCSRIALANGAVLGPPDLRVSNGGDVELQEAYSGAVTRATDNDRNGRRSAVRCKSVGHLLCCITGFRTNVRNSTPILVIA